MALEGELENLNDKLCANVTDASPAKLTDAAAGTIETMTVCDVWRSGATKVAPGCPA